MAHVDFAHGCEVNLLFTNSLGDAKCESTFHVQDTSDAIFSDPLSFTNSVWTAWTTNVLPTLANVVIYNAIQFVDMRTLPYAGIVYGHTPVAGSISTGSTAMPNNTAIAIKRLTAAPGRAGRGRLFLPLWANALLSAENTVSATVVANMQSGLAAFQAAVEGISGTIKVGILSTELGGAPRAHGVFNQVTSYTHTDLVPDSMRRRLPGRGT